MLQAVVSIVGPVSDPGGAIIEAEIHETIEIDS